MREIQLTAYDVIGDIHGQADKLEALLKKMGYVASGNGYRAPAGRKAVFLGDLIDRGPSQLRVVTVVRAMVESGDALSIMGNHEFNAIGYVTEDPQHPGECLRPNLGDTNKCGRNRKQHAEFLSEVGDRSAQHMEWVNWFKTLPVYLDLDGIRVVHATWNDRAVAAIEGSYWNATGRQMSDAFLFGSHEKDSDLMGARKLLTCGVEWELPEGLVIHGKGGETHGEVRVANWRHSKKWLREVALVPRGNEHTVPDIPIPADVPILKVIGAPVFVGHHWFAGTPAIESTKFACLDWSAAKEGPLVAYRWDGETELSNDKLVWTGSTEVA